MGALLICTGLGANRVCKLQINVHLPEMETKDVIYVRCLTDMSSF